jgi:hypothetical protein
MELNSAKPSIKRAASDEHILILIPGKLGSAMVLSVI